MTIPSLTPALDGILSVAAVPPGSPWTRLLAPDGSGLFISINPEGVVSYSSDDSPYTQCIVSPDGQKASFMPLRSGGPLPGARWWHYGLIVVPTAGL